MLIVTLSLLGCAAPVEAPAELSALSGWLFEAYDDDERVAVGLDSLAALLTAPPEEGYLLDPVTDANIAGVSHPGRDPADCIGVALASESPFSPEAHTALVVLDDLTPISPTAERFARDFATDPGCFADGECDEVETISDIYRSNLLLSLGFTIHKDYRRVDLGGGQTALVARGWMAEPAHGDSGDNHLWQSYELDVWLPTEDGGSRRMLAMWSEGEYAGVSEDLQVSLLRMGIRDVLAAQDDYLAAPSR